jgi:multidrug transporter EmrE-like cation transporter
MAWIYLFIAGLMEIGWPPGLKFSQTQVSRRIASATLIVIVIIGLKLASN